MIRPPPSSTLFPFTTLFRSSGAHALGVVADRDRRDRLRRPVVDDDDLVLAADRDPALVARWATSAGSRSAARTRSSSSTTGRRSRSRRSRSATTPSACAPEDRKSVVKGKRVELGGGRIITKKKQ